MLACAAALFILFGACVHFEYLDARDSGPSNTRNVQSLEATLRKDVSALSEKIGRRNVGVRGSLEASRRYLEGRIASLGLLSSREVYISTSWNPYVGTRLENSEVANVHFRIEGDGNNTGEVVVGAHYDTARMTPGADDNASGCAALLAIAEAMLLRPSVRTVHFIFFVNEEPPAFQTDDMGSLVAARALAKDGVEVYAMLSLESIGFFSDRPGSQYLPFPFSWIYPDTADYLFFIGDPKSSRAIELATKTFRDHSSVPVEGGGIPDLVPGIGFSDQWSFWKVGYPGIMVTDTALFRNPHYHKPSDLPKTLDFRRMSDAVAGLIEVVAALANDA